MSQPAETHQIIHTGGRSIGSLQAGELRHLLDRFDEQVQTYHHSIVTDGVACQAANEQNRSV